MCEDQRRRGSSNSWTKGRDEIYPKNSRRRQTLQGPALIPPAYPAAGYTSIYTTYQDKDSPSSNNRVSEELNILCREVF